MKRIEIEITGTTALLCNNFTDAAMAAASSGTRMVAVGDKGTPREQAEPKLYLGILTGLPMVPQPNLFRCLIDAGVFFKAGKSKVTTAKSSMIPACVDVEGTELPLYHPNGGALQWEVDSRAVVIPSTGGRILCHRPRFDEWALTFTANIDTGMIAPKLFREIVDAAGLRIGLGDFRPARKGPFGKFVVTKWQEGD